MANMTMRKEKKKKKKYKELGEYVFIMAILLICGNTVSAFISLAHDKLEEA